MQRLKHREKCDTLVLTKQIREDYNMELLKRKTDKVLKF